MGNEGAGGFLAGLTAGTRIAGYRLEEQIGRGGMAVVFRALDERLQRPVALKILAPDLSADQAFRSRFIRESRGAAAVDDPHIIPVFEAGDSGGVLFIAMRYVPGGDVRTVLDREGPLPPARAAAIISAVASALDAAHAAGLVHRDVKPANMLVDARPGRPEHVYLSDFGLSKGTLSSAGITGTGQFLGTLEYCAPEQIQGGPVDGRADEYALACAAFELLSGRPPFQADQALTVLYAQLSEPPPLLSARLPGIPAAADQVLVRGLAKAPGERFATCREFAEALRAALGLQPYDSARVAGPPGHPPTEVAWLGPAGAGPRAGASGPDTILPGAGPAAAPAPGVPGAGAPFPGAGAPFPRAGAPLPGMGGAGQGAPFPGAGGPGAGAPFAGPGYPARPDRRSGRRRAALIALAVAGVLASGGVAAAAILVHPAGQTGALKPGGSPSVGPGSTSRQGTGGTPGPSASRSPTPATSGTTTPGTTGASARYGTTQTARLVQTLPSPALGSPPVKSVAFSSRGLLATGESNGNTYLYPVGGSQPFATLRTGSEVYAVAFSPNGALVATGDRNGRTYLWKAATGSWITTIHVPGEKDVNSLAFSPQGGMLAIGSANGTTYLWDISRSGHTVTPSGTLANPATGEGIWSLAFNPEGTVLATGDYAGDTYLWHLPAPSSQPALLPGPAGQPITAVAFSADGDTLATGTGDVFGTGSRISSAYLWDVSTGHRVSVIGEPATVWGVAFDAAGTLAIGDADGSTYLVNGATGQPIEPLADPSSGTQGVGAVAFSDNGRVLAAGDTNGATYLWKVS